MYSYKQKQDIYYITKNGKQLLTPAKSKVYTTSQTLADDLTKDLEIYGEDPTNICSIVAFHYAYIDFYKDTPRRIIESNIASGLDRNVDWTFQNHKDLSINDAIKTFGKYEEQKEKCLKWLSQISLHQLAAVCVVGRALESVNIVYLAAEIYKVDGMPSLIDLVYKFYPYVNKTSLNRHFNKFFSYFAITEDPAPNINSGSLNKNARTVVKILANKKVNKSKMLLRDETKHIKCEFDGDDDKCRYNCDSCPIDLKTQGDFSLQIGLYDDAIAYYKKAIQKEKKFAEAWNNMGNAYGNKSDYENALKAFNEAIRLDNIYGKALLGKAITLRNMGKYQDAIAVLNSILELYDNPDCIRIKEDILKYCGKLQ